MQATSGIEIKTEDYENIRTQRRHFPFVADNISEEVKNDITEKIVIVPEGGTIGSKAAAGVETKIENYENIRTQRRHFPFAADNISEELEDANNKVMAAEGETETNVEEMIESEAAAGIETEIENYESIHTQRRHFPFTADNVSEELEDTNSEEKASESEGEIEVDVETIESEAAAGVETKVENYENLRTQRRHFPGSTTTNIFGLNC